MISEVYDAFIAAGTPEEKARKAAEALTDYDQRFDRIEREMIRTRAELTLVKWMVGFVIALDVAILLRVLYRYIGRLLWP
jgi:hypothetical protein